MCIGKIYVRVRHKDGTAEKIFVPCGKCIECERQRANDFARRCVDEASLYKDCCVVTLTYNSDHLPDGESLCRRDVQLFLKRLRKRHDVRYFGCGEYGSKKGRPHYHLLIFGWCPDDGVYSYTSDKGVRYYRSKELDAYWSLLNKKTGERSYIGYTSFSKGIDEKSAFYSSLYLQKRINRSGQVKPFILASHGLGLQAAHLTQDGFIYRNGKKILAPRYYRLKLMSEAHRKALCIVPKKAKPLYGRLNSEKIELIQEKVEKLDRFYNLPT